MNEWLYQLSAGTLNYRPKVFADKVTEEAGEIRWTCKTKSSVQAYERDNPAAGDRVIFYFCQTGLEPHEQPGLYGVGTVTDFYNDKRRGRLLAFTADAPTNVLRLSPLWGGDVQRIIERIRDTPRRTMWWMSHNDFQTLERLMFSHA